MKRALVMPRDERIDGEIWMGPKMRALPRDSIREFCMAYCTNGGNAVQACHTAGYTGVKMTGWRLLQRRDVQEAMQELCEYELKSLTPAAVRGMRDILADPGHKDFGKVVFGVLDRTGLHMKTEHKQVIEHSIADEQLTDAIHQLAGELGLDPKKLLGNAAKVIDAEVVEPVDDLEDMI